jgi:2-polyprenyl-3-methyl-5-hydroxy-6-metoxy-1,4-benzoquinol methylase
MNELLQEIILKIEKINPMHGKKLKKNSRQSDPDYTRIAADFLDKYKRYLKSIGKDFDYAVECYLKVVSDMVYEQVRFMETGEYSNKSFKDVYRRVYNNPEVMLYHMHGLLLSQILWQQHYKTLSFFTETLPQFKDTIKSYLEIGGGHGFFISEALQILNKDASFALVDISQSSLDIAKKFIESSKVNYVLQDIFSFKSEQKYDFIAMGEILEHVEQPLALLNIANSLLSNNGIIFITVPANAPAIDHIYLFKNDGEIREIINSAGFEVLREIYAFAEDIPQEKAEKFKVPMMYGAFLKKNRKQ